MAKIFISIISLFLVWLLAPITGLLVGVYSLCWFSCTETKEIGPLIGGIIFGIGNPIGLLVTIGSLFLLHILFSNTKPSLIVFLIACLLGSVAGGYINYFLTQVPPIGLDVEILPGIVIGSTVAAAFTASYYLRSILLRRMF